MGSLLGGFATLGGAECFLIDTWKEHVDTINSEGLTIYNNEDEPFTVKCRAFTSADQVGEKMDMIVVLVMGHVTRAAVEAAKCLCDEHTYCLTLQNGIGNVEVIEEYFPKEKILYGIMPYGGSMMGPGKAKTMCSPNASSHFASDAFEEPNEFMLEFEKIMCGHGLDFRAEKKSVVDSIVWWKLAKNCSGNPVCAVVRLPLGPYTNSDAAHAVETALFMEVAAVAKVQGITLTGWDTGNKMKPDSKMFWHLPSTAQDVKAKKKTEIDYLNGAVARLGDKYGIPTPYNHMITALVKIVEQNYENQF